MKIVELDGVRLSALVRNEARGIVVDFWSPWCAPCRALRPHLDRLADEHEDTWRFVAVNTDEDASASEAFNVRALPTLVWFRGGEEIARLDGGVTLSSVAAKLEALAR